MVVKHNLTSYSVLWGCTLCQRGGTISTSTRINPSDKEDLDQEIDQTKRSVAKKHSIISPKCRARGHFYFDINVFTSSEVN